MWITLGNEVGFRPLLSFFQQHMRYCFMDVSVFIDMTYVQREEELCHALLPVFSLEARDHHSRAHHWKNQEDYGLFDQHQDLLGEGDPDEIPLA